MKLEKMRELYLDYLHHYPDAIILNFILKLIKVAELAKEQNERLSLGYYSAIEEAFDELEEL